MKSRRTQPHASRNRGKVAQSMADNQLPKFVTRAPAMLQRRAIDVDDMDQPRWPDGPPALIVHSESKQSTSLASKSVLQTQKTLQAQGPALNNITSGGEQVQHKTLTDIKKSIQDYERSSAILEKARLQKIHT